jgi:hypothetical protein
MRVDSMVSGIMNSKFKPLDRENNLGPLTLVNVLWFTTPNFNNPTFSGTPHVNLPLGFHIAILLYPISLLPVLPFCSILFSFNLALHHLPITRLISPKRFDGSTRTNTGMNRVFDSRLFSFRFAAFIVFRVPFHTSFTSFFFLLRYTTLYALSSYSHSRNRQLISFSA